MANYRVRIEPTRAGNFQVRYFNKGGKRGNDGTIKTVRKDDEMWAMVPAGAGHALRKTLLKGAKLAEWIAKEALQQSAGENFNGLAIGPHLSIEELKEKFFYAFDRKGLSERTRLHYEIDIRRAVEAIEPKTPEDFTPEKLEAYVDAMRKAGLTNETIRGRLAGLGRFFKWLVEEKYLFASPLSAKKLVPKENLKEPKYYTDAGYLALKDAAAQISRPLAILCSLAHGSGLRKCEAVGHEANDHGVTWDDLTWNRDGTVDLLLRKEIVKGGAKSRSVPLSPETIALLGPRRSGPLVELTRFQADHLFIKARALAGLTDHVKSFKGIKYLYDIHGLRHTFAKNRLQNGNDDLRTLQILMGHASSKTTEIYVQFEKKHFQTGTALAYQRQMQAEEIIRAQKPAGVMQVISPKRAISR